MDEDREIIRTRSGNSFSFPMEMDEPKPEPPVQRQPYGNQNVLTKEKKVSELYTKKEEPKPKKFKPTPVISPVYGVLDKNYTKEEVKDFVNEDKLSETLENYYSKTEADEKFITYEIVDEHFATKDDISEFLTEDEIIGSILYGNIGESIRITDEEIGELNK